MPSFGDVSAGVGREWERLNSPTIRRPATGARHPSEHIRHGPNLNRVARTLRDFQRSSGPGPRALRDEAGSAAVTLVLPAGQPRDPRGWLPPHD